MEEQQRRKTGNVSSSIPKQPADGLYKRSDSNLNAYLDSKRKQAGGTGSKLKRRVTFDAAQHKIKQ